MRFLLALAAAALAVAGSTSAPGAAPASPCAKPRVGFLGPLTGPAAFLGKEQLGFARYAARVHGARSVRILELDTQLRPARAAAAARRLRANPQVLAIVGPAGSQEVLAAAPVLTRGERIAFVSASALAANLTNGSIPGFFRVVPSEAAQAPAVARFLLGSLRARDVAILDDGTTYSRRLAERVQARLRAAGVRATQTRVDPSRTDFGDVVSGLRPGTDAVFLPWHVAATADLIAREVRRRLPRAAIVGGDALDSRDFAVANAHVAVFAPDLRRDPRHAEFLRGYGRPVVSRFGPPAYVAAEVAVRAVRAACADGRATRREVLGLIRATDLRGTVLGPRLRFTARGDVRGASYAVERVSPEG